MQDEMLEIVIESLVAGLLMARGLDRAEDGVVEILGPEGYRMGAVMVVAEALGLRQEVERRALAKLAADREVALDLDAL